MSSNEELLMKLAKHVLDENINDYQYHFIVLINFLQKGFKISEGSKAGSIEKGIKLKDQGDLDIIFYIENLDDENFDEIREEITNLLPDRFQKSTLKSKAITMQLDDENEIDLVLKNKSEYKNEKSYLDHFNNLNEQRKNAVILVRYWISKSKFKTDKTKKYNIEQYAIYSSGKSLITIIGYAVNKIGGNVKAAKESLLNEARNI